ncbi:MAG: cell division protein FtsQ [Eubacterium sp.]|nr:cell division protein FtsQ [Eubacterium sp.]MBQ9022382.1 cell division protein FtsQ [Eubacterium sp.]
MSDQNPNEKGNVPVEDLERMDLEEKERIIERKVRRHRIVVRVILALAILVALGVVIVWKVFTVEEVRVEGNHLHSAKSIQSTVLSDKYSWNSLYVLVSYRLLDHSEEFPYADSVSVSLTDPHTVVVNVDEKDMVAYYYDSATKKYVGFSETGEVLLLANKAPEEYVRVTGLKPEKKVELYKKMALEDDSILAYIKSVLMVLSNYDIPPEVICIQNNNNLLLSYGDIQVNLGDSYYLNEKIVRMQQLLQKVEGQTGTLHLETWTESTTDIYFRMGELQTIPQS